MWKITDYLLHQIFSHRMVADTVYIVSSRHMCVYIFICLKMKCLSQYINFFKKELNLYKHFSCL